ncbi:hypothetical protein CWE17_11675 [Synechococcus sp. BS56D]|nr:hypothetical protein CWE17_11675 [Synechococcus sp. BS56D]
MLCFSALSGAAKAQDNGLNCEAFSSGFTTPEGCLDGSQPSSGPTSGDQWQVDDDAGLWPDEGFDPGFLLY